MDVSLSDWMVVLPLFAQLVGWLIFGCWAGRLVSCRLLVCFWYWLSVYSWFVWMCLVIDCLCHVVCVVLPRMVVWSRIIDLLMFFG